MTTLILMLKKIERADKKNMTHLIHTQKQKQLLMNVTLMVCLNQSILQFY